MISFVIFIFGLVVGSFLNAIIFRLEKGESALKGRSRCPYCKHSLSWQDLIPVLSFILLKGQCRYCVKKISIQYPLVEIGTALLFLAILNFDFLMFNQFSIFQFSKFLYLLTITSLLIVIFVYDLRHYIIPDKILFPAIGIVALFRVFEFVKFGNWNLEPLINPLLAASLASAFFFALYYVSRGTWMGFGDVKLAAFMGLFLGWPNILVALFVAFVTGAIIGVGLMAAQKKGLKSEVPFGPFLITGTFAALFWGKLIANWYVNLVLV